MRCGLLIAALVTACGSGHEVDPITLADAIERSDAVSVRQVLEAAGSSGRIPPLLSGQGALQRAAEIGDTLVLRVLKDHGGALEAPDLRGEVPLMAAVRAHQQLSVRWLLAQSVPVDPVPEGRPSPLAIAILQNDVAIANDLITAGADLDRRIRQPKGTVRDLATATGTMNRLVTTAGRVRPLPPAPPP